jgi:hypothetical protein
MPYLRGGNNRRSLGRWFSSALFRAKGGTHGFHSADDFLVEPEDVLLHAYIGGIRENIDQSPARHSTKMTVSFDEHGLRAASGSGDRRTDTSRPAACDHNIHIPGDTNFTRRLRNELKRCLSRHSIPPG